MDFKKLFCFLFLFLFLFSFVSAEENDVSQSSSGVSAVGVYDSIQKVVGKGMFEFIFPPSNTLSRMANFIGYFFIGFFAGLYLFIIITFIRLFDYLKMKVLGMRRRLYNPFSGGKTVWFGIIAGRLWKVFLMGMGYAVIMQIPYINKIFWILTLDFYAENLFVKAFYVALIVGITPSLFEYYWKVKLSTQYDQAIEEEMKAKANVKKN